MFHLLSSLWYPAVPQVDVLQLPHLSAVYRSSKGLHVCPVVIAHILMQVTPKSSFLFCLAYGNIIMTFKKERM